MSAVREGCMNESGVEIIPRWYELDPMAIRVVVKTIDDVLKGGERNE